MKMVKFYQKSLLVSFYYPPEWLLRQYINMSNFLIFILCGHKNIKFEPCHEKTNILHMRKQRRRSASR